MTSNSARIEFFFDCSSPWTYLAFENIQPLAADHGAEIVWRPFLVGGVFNTINPSVYQSRATPVPAKAAYMFKDMQDWARLAGLAIKFPPSVFPVNSVKAMRACLVADLEGKLPSFARAVFRAYWGDDLDISQDEVLTRIAARVGLGDDLLASAGAPEIKATLRGTTDELIARGGFGSPTMFIDGADMYFGNDRLELVAAALRRK